MIEMQHEYNNGKIKYSTTTSLLSPSFLIKKTAYLLISMKNALFSKRFIDWSVQYANSLNLNLIVSVVDTPYKACIEKTSINADLLKYEKVKQDTYKKVNTIKSVNEFATFYNWEELEKKCPKWIQDEFNQAFNLKNKVFDNVCQQTKLILGDLSNYELAYKTRFILSEFPVLIWLYYETNESKIDMYPGENADFFTFLENGFFKDELPSISKLITENNRLIYANLKLDTKI